MTELEKALSGKEFIKGIPELKVRRDRAESLCFALNTTPPEDQTKRNALLRELLPNAVHAFTIKPPFLREYGDYISFGKNFFVNYNCKLMDGGKITFGDDVLIGPDCTFVTATHPTDHQRRLAGFMAFLPITVGSNVWFGAGVTVCPGVRIGDHCVIGAGSVVVSDIPSYAVAAGNPCKVIRLIPPEQSSL